jgi:hypothetical protein
MKQAEARARPCSVAAQRRIKSLRRAMEVAFLMDPIPRQEPAQAIQRVAKHLLRRRVVGASGEIVLEVFVGIELVGHAAAGQFLVQHHALVERDQLVIHAVQEAEGRHAFQMENRTILVAWVAIDNTSAI